MTNGSGPFGELKTDYVFDTEHGVIISEKHRRIAEIVHDYNPELSLMWIPPSTRDDTDEFPFLVVHTMSNGSQYPVMHLTLEDMDNPQLVIGRLFAGDMAKHGGDQVLVAIEAAEKADEVYRAKEDEERWAAKMDFVSTFLNSPLNTFKHDGKKYRK